MDTDLLISLLFILFLLLCSGFFSGSETGLTAVSRSRIYHLVMEGNKRAKKVSRLREHKEALIGAILLGNNAVNILASALATSLAINYWGENGVAYATIIMTLLVLIFAEVLPKTYAIQNAEKVALTVAPLLTVIVKALSPLTSLIQAINRLLLRLLGIRAEEGQSLLSATNVLRGTIEMHHREGDMYKFDRDMLGSILDLSEIDVEEVMVHRKHVETIDMDQPVEDIIKQAVNSSYSRLPLWQDTPDNIIGVLHVKSLLILTRDKNKAVPTKEDIINIAAKPWFVPESTSLRDQLLAFRRRRQHFAIVIDEYGVMLGIVTLEDIIEEIVGEIEDEYDIRPRSDIVRLKGGKYSVQGSVTIRDLNRELDWNLPDDDATTIAGLLLHEARIIPETGQRFEFHGVRFTVRKREGNQITRLMLEKLPEPQRDSGD